MRIYNWVSGGVMTLSECFGEPDLGSNSSAIQVR